MIINTQGAVLTAALDRPGSPWVGRDAGDQLLTGMPIIDEPRPWLTPSEKSGWVPAVDVLIDFSAPKATMEHARLAAELGMVVWTINRWIICPTLNRRPVQPLYCITYTTPHQGRWHFCGI